METKPSAPPNDQAQAPVRWLNRTVFGIGLASLFSDWSHETATTALPAFLASLGVAAAWLGLIEGVADGLSSFAKMASGYYTDRLRHRKPIAVTGYVVTALGTAAFGLATSAWHVLIARAMAWLGRGVRTPVRKALMAAAVDRATYGRAFGFERMMDTVGAIVGPASAYYLLHILHFRYSSLFACTLAPGLMAAAMIGFLVQERNRAQVPHLSLVASLRRLPSTFRKYLLAVGMFGLGDFSHTLLILLATQRLASSLGTARAASVAIGLYVIHNVLYASFSYIGGWLADRWDKRWLLAGGYFLAAIMALGIIVLPSAYWSLLIVFILGGIYVALEETLEDSLCAELAPSDQHGMAFGSLATVNGLGDFASSVVVGLLWTSIGARLAFAYSAVLFLLGGILVLRLQVSAAKP
ncbi:MAG: MFS transporter [Candidatus Omnitrophica bacterium]|nr:MFS transporter [Candidatus Omnitrophota bacterium]